MAPGARPRVGLAGELQEPSIPQASGQVSSPCVLFTIQKTSCSSTEAGEPAPGCGDPWKNQKTVLPLSPALTSPSGRVAGCRLNVLLSANHMAGGCHGGWGQREARSDGQSGTKPLDCV